MNHAAERLYGISSSEALGRLNTELFNYEWLSPGDEKEAKSTLRDSGTWRGVTIHRKRDGETIFVDVTLSTLEDDRGDVTGMLCSLQDITEQKRADLELRIKDMAIASSLGAVALTDLEGRIVYVNRASSPCTGGSRRRSSGNRSRWSGPTRRRGSGSWKRSSRTAHGSGRLRRDGVMGRPSPCSCSLHRHR